MKISKFIISFILMISLLINFVHATPPLPPTNQVAITIFPTESATKPGDTLIHKVTVKNRGNVPDIIVINSIDAPNDWKVELKENGSIIELPHYVPNLTFTLAPEEERQFALKIQTPSSASKAEIKINIHSYADRTKKASATLSISISTPDTGGGFYSGYSPKTTTNLTYENQTKPQPEEINKELESTLEIKILTRTIEYNLSKKVELDLIKSLVKPKGEIIIEEANISRTIELIESNEKGKISYQTRVELKVTSEKQNLKVFELIPKSFANTTDEIEFNPFPTILENDPIVEWNLNREIFTYSVKENKFFENFTKPIIYSIKEIEVPITGKIIVSTDLMAAIFVIIIIAVLVSWIRFRRWKK